MPGFVIWILFAVGCVVMVVAGVRAKREEQKKAESVQQDPRRAA